MDAAASTLTTYDLNAPAGETLAALQGNGEAWRGALIMFAGMAADEAAAKAGVEAGEIGIAVDEAACDYAGLASPCERTAKFLARWIDRHLGGAKDYSGGTRRSDVRQLADGRFSATFEIHPGAF